MTPHASQGERLLLMGCGSVGAKFRRLERGRRPEIDFMNGYVVERGQEKGVLTALVREIEAGTRSTSPDNLASLL